MGNTKRIGADIDKGSTSAMSLSLSDNDMMHSSNPTKPEIVKDDPKKIMMMSRTRKSCKIQSTPSPEPPLQTEKKKNSKKYLPVPDKEENAMNDNTIQSATEIYNEYMVTPTPSTNVRHLKSNEMSPYH